MFQRLGILTHCNIGILHYKQARLRKDMQHSVIQKLAILGFSPKIFFILTLVTSETSWGQTMSLKF